jgi:hypothetical protein
MGKMKEKVYNHYFMYLVQETNIDYVVNLEYEYGIEEVIREAYKRGFSMPGNEIDEGDYV